MVLEETPVGVYDHHAIVADALKVVHLVQIHTSFPCPFAHGYFLAVLFSEGNAIVELGEG